MTIFILAIISSLILCVDENNNQDRSTLSLEGLRPRTRVVMTHDNFRGIVVSPENPDTENNVLNDVSLNSLFKEDEKNK